MSNPDMLEMLHTADESTLRQVIERASTLLAQRQQSRRREAIEKAASELEAAGISADEFAELVGQRGRAKKAQVGKARTPKGRYLNPVNQDQAYEVGRGRPPKWFTDLKARGELPEPESPSVREG